MDERSGTSARRAPISPIGGFLERFRRTTGMPAAVGDEVAVELAPVLRALDELEAGAAVLLERSEQGAARHLHEAREEAATILADARSRADSERGDALKAGLRAADAAAAEELAAGEAEARRIDRVGAERVPPLARRIARSLLEVEP